MPICKFYPNCWRGTSCKYLHTNLNVNASEFEPHGKMSKTLETLPLVVTTEPSTEPTLDLSCGICYEKPSCYGILNLCNHLYCYSCVKEWRDLKSMGDTRRTCPICRTLSSFFFPLSSTQVINMKSLALADQEVAKEELRQIHLRKLKEKPCKFINKLPPDSNFCPFKDSCHFSHLDTSGNLIPVRRDAFRRRGRAGRELTAQDIHSLTILFQQHILDAGIYSEEEDSDDIHEFMGHEDLFDWEDDEDDEDDYFSDSDEDDDIDDDDDYY
jgi:hypothetical protein